MDCVSVALSAHHSFIHSEQTALAGYLPPCGETLAALHLAVEDPSQDVEVQSGDAQRESDA